MQLRADPSTHAMLSREDRPRKFLRAGACAGATGCVGRDGARGGATGRLAPMTRLSRRPFRPALAVALTLGLLVAALGLACGAAEEAPEPVDPKPASALRPTDGGLYLVGLQPRGGPAPIGALHEWVLTVERPDGRPFSPRRIAVDGGMPQHGHGFVTQPRVTGALSPREFLIEGMKFHMGGDWVLRVDVVGEAGPDVATFDVHVAP